MKTYKDVDEYMQHVPQQVAFQVQEMRSLVRTLIPHGVEVIRYGMPTIQLNGKNVVHFAAMKGHLGFYPAPSGVAAYQDELKDRGIDFSKGCIRFSYQSPLPVALIKKIIKVRLQEEKAKSK